MHSSIDIMASTHAAIALVFTLVATGSALPQNGTIFECTSEGRFADPLDCTSFFTCVSEPDGSLARSKGDCKGYAFHPDLRTCVNPSKVSGCTPRKPKQLLTDKSLAAVCTSSGFVCGNCKTVVNCVGTEAYKDSTCGDGYFCSVSGSGSLAGAAACLSNDRADPECSCTEDDLNLPKTDPYNELGFIFCPPDGSDLEVHMCAQSQMYSAEQQKCVSYDNGEICTMPGNFMKTGCTGLYSCWLTSDGLIKRNYFHCPEGMMVSKADVELCSDPCDWPRPDHDCVADGRFKDPTDCSKFVVCAETIVGSGVFTKTIGQCPGDYLWDKNAAGGSGLCADADTVTCDPPVLKKSPCPIEDIVCP